MQREHKLNNQPLFLIFLTGFTLTAPIVGLTRAKHWLPVAPVAQQRKATGPIQLKNDIILEPFVVVHFTQKDGQTTYMTTLCNAQGTSHATLYLSHVYNTCYTDDLQHAIVMSWLGKLVLLFHSPRICTRSPAAR